MKKPITPLQQLALPASRWTAYVIAGAATTGIAVPAAEAAVHYSGPVNTVFNRESQAATFPLSAGVSLAFRFEGSADHYYDAASFKVSGAQVSQKVRGRQLGPLSFAARLRFGAVVPKGPFFTPLTGRYANFGQYYSSGNWATAGVGYLGFEFNNGNGKQYGWARVRTKGKPAYTFIVEDYGWADPGESITAGQTTDSPGANLPAMGSLGALALGAAGLVSWRRSRSVFR